MSDIFKWDIIFVSKFPESIKCSNCGDFFIPYFGVCTECNKKIRISRVMPKKRPVLIWISKSKWHKSMAFGIPLSKDVRKLTKNYDQLIEIKDCKYLNTNPIYQIPRNAAINQATRIDGNNLNSNDIIAKLTNEVIKNLIQDKLIEWLFSEN